MRKDRTDSPLAALTEAQQDELFATLRHMPYGRAVEWAFEKFQVVTSTAALARWWTRQSRARLRAQIRRDIDTSSQFDRIADDEVLDERMRKALKDGFFRYLSANDEVAALDFAKMALQANAGVNSAAELELKKMRLGQQQDALALARAKFETDAAKAAMAHAARIRGIQADDSLDADAKILAVRGALFGEVPA